MQLRNHGEHMQLRNHADPQSVKYSNREKCYAIFCIYSIKSGMLVVRENQIALRKFSDGTAQLRSCAP